MRRGARRLFLLFVALAPPACSTYGRDETTIVQVHDDAAADSGGPDDASTMEDGVAADGSVDGEAGGDAGRAAHRVFVTALGYSGSDVTSTANADVICANEAFMGGLAGNFRAWLSDGNSNAAVRIVDDAPWSRVDGELVAVSVASLESGVLTNAIDVTARNQKVGVPAWTGTVTNGTASGNDCNAWTSNDPAQSGSTGSSTATDATWTNAGTQACNLKLHLYCFSQPD